MSTPGAMRTAERIRSEGNLLSDTYVSEISAIIDEEMHGAEVLNVLKLNLIEQERVSLAHHYEDSPGMIAARALILKLEEKP